MTQQRDKRGAWIYWLGRGRYGYSEEISSDRRLLKAVKEVKSGCEKAGEDQGQLLKEGQVSKYAGGLDRATQQGHAGRHLVQISSWKHLSG
jgi:hypothetical protein